MVINSLVSTWVNGSYKYMEMLCSGTSGTMSGRLR